MVNKPIYTVPPHRLVAFYTSFVADLPILLPQKMKRTKSSLRCAVCARRDVLCVCNFHLCSTIGSRKKIKSENKLSRFSSPKRNDSRRYKSEYEKRTSAQLANYLLLCVICSILCEQRLQSLVHTNFTNSLRIEHLVPLWHCFVCTILLWPSLWLLNWTATAATCRWLAIQFLLFNSLIPVSAANMVSNSCPTTSYLFVIDSIITSPPPPGE